VIIDITNEVLTKIKTELGTMVSEVSASYQPTSPTFPIVTVEELNNLGDVTTKDSSGEQYSNCSIEINIFTIGNSKVTTAKNIRNKIDLVCSDFYGMSRDFSQATKNYLDDSIYKYTLRYSFRVSKTKKIYRG